MKTTEGEQVGTLKSTYVLAGINCSQWAKKKKDHIKWRKVYM